MGKALQNKLKKRTALLDSAYELFTTMGFNHTTIRDIASKAGVAKGTFYLYFKDKYDLVNWIFYTDFVLLASTRTYHDGWDLIRTLAELFYNDRDFYRCALEIEGQNSFRDYFYESTTPIMNMLMHDLGSDEAQIQINNRYMSDAFLAILYRWLKSGMDQDPELFVDNMKRIIANLSARAREHME